MRVVLLAAISCIGAAEAFLAPPALFGAAARLPPGASTPTHTPLLIFTRVVRSAGNAVCLYVVVYNMRLHVHYVMQAN